MIFTFILIGMIKSFSKPRFVEILVIVYLSVLIIYPYRSAGIRFLFPIMPFLLIFLVRGIETVTLFPGIKKTMKACILGSLVILSYLNMYYYIWKDQGNVIPGPQEQSSQEAFSYIRDHTETDAVILFCKPRVLALYTARYSLANSKDDTQEKIDELISTFGVDYVLLHKDISDDAISEWYTGKAEREKVIWKNSKFTLIKADPALNED